MRKSESAAEIYFVNYPSRKAFLLLTHSLTAQLALSNPPPVDVPFLTSFTLISNTDALTTDTMVELPDPTVDLDWSGYVGAVHEIFHKNALTYPDRPCVTETKSYT